MSTLQTIFARDLAPAMEHLKVTKTNASVRLKAINGAEMKGFKVISATNGASGTHIDLQVVGISTVGMVLNHDTPIDVTGIEVTRR